jgi:predicted peptidase
MTQPKRFAAIAPVSGYSNLKAPCALKNNHIWAFHGEVDDVVPIRDEQPIVDAAKACGIDVTYTVYANGNHNAWDATYANPTLYGWFLEHKN